MKTQDEQLAFARENQRLTDEYSRLSSELGLLKPPADNEQIKAKLGELSNVIRDMRQLTQSYMNDKLSYEEWKEKNKDVVLSDEAKEDLAKYHDDVKLQEALDFMLRQLYQVYLQSE